VACLSIVFISQVIHCFNNLTYLKDILIKYTYLKISFFFLFLKERIRLVQFNDEHQIFFSFKGVFYIFYKAKTALQKAFILI
jgi:hypothetical protein